MSTTKINLTGQQINNALKLAATSCSVAASPASLALKFVGTGGSSFTAEIPVVSTTSCGVMTAAQYSDFENTKAKVSDLETKAAKIATQTKTMNGDLLFNVTFLNSSGSTLYGFDIPKASETTDGLMTKADKKKLSRVAEIYHAVPLSNITKQEEIVVTPIGTKGQFGIDTYDGKLFLYIAGVYTTKWLASQCSYGLSWEDFRRINVLINANGMLYVYNGTRFVN